MFRGGLVIFISGESHREMGFSEIEIALHFLLMLEVVFEAVGYKGFFHKGGVRVILGHQISVQQLQQTQQSRTEILDKSIRYLLSYNNHSLVLEKINKMDFQISSTEQLKIIANALCKMGKFFNEMTELCLSQLDQRGSIRDKHRDVLTKESSKNIQNSRKLQKLKGAEGSSSRDIKMQRIMSLKPKHPVSSFFSFYREKGQEIAKANGETIGSRVAKIVAETWKNMSQAEKQPFQIKSRESRLKYQEEMAEYKVKYADQIAKLKKYKRELKESKKSKKQKDLKQCGLQQKQEYSLHSVGEKQPMQFDKSALESQSQSVLCMSQDMSDSFDQQMHSSSSSSSLNQTSQIQCKQQEIISREERAIKEEDVSLLNAEELQEAFTHHEKTYQKVQTIKKEHNQVIQPEIVPKTEAKETQKSMPPQKQKFNRPKGPVSSFLAFYQAEGKRIALENHLSLGPNTIKFASQIWKGMSASSKQKYEKISEQSRTKYRQQAEQIRKKYGEDALDKKKPKNVQKQKKTVKKQGLSVDQS